MAIKKSALYSSLWQSCDELRGGMDASQYKDYILTLLFVKYVSDKYAGKEHSVIKIPPGGAFSDLVALKGNKEIGDKINKSISKLAEANDLKGVIDIADFNAEDKLGKGKGMQDLLSNLISIFNDLDLRGNRAEGDDLLGDAYEYLMRHFATLSGKNKGQFYTPAEVSRMMAKVIGIDEKTHSHQTVYDPTCGSGSLLLKVADEVPHKITIYGQEKDVTTTTLAKMNMILHGHPTADIAPGGYSTLSNPAFADKVRSKLKRHDFIVANPPFSEKSWQNGFSRDEKKKTIHDPYERFGYGIPPPKNGDYAFLLHIIYSMKDTGKGAVILPYGVLFRGNAEENIRKAIVKRGYIKGIIGLPANLFYGTGIPACILVLDKEHAGVSKGIFMIDASKDFIKDGDKNRLRERDIHKIVDTFNGVLEVAGYSRMVPVSEIADSKNNYSLNLPRYIDGGSEDDIHDLTAHLNGGIPKRDVDDLKEYWDILKNMQRTLFKKSDNPNYLIARIPSDQVKDTILNSAECQTHRDKVKSVLACWKEKNEDYLKGLKRGCKPKEVIGRIAEDLFAAFSCVALIDKYDIYQYLMDYWLETMQDDVYQISAYGWKKAAEVRPIIEEKGKGKKVGEVPDLVVGRGKKVKKYKADLIPPHLIMQRYYTDEQEIINNLEIENETVTQNIEALIDEHGDEQGLLAEVVNEKRSLATTRIKERMREIKGNTDFDDEIVVLQQGLDLMSKKGELISKIRSLWLELNEKVLAHYDDLSIDEIKELVVCDKWFTKLTADVEYEVERVIQSLASRIKELEERYTHPMPELTKKVADYSTRVKMHLKKMGLNW